MNPEHHSSNTGLPSFQSFFQGQDGINRFHRTENHGLSMAHNHDMIMRGCNNSDYSDSIQSSKALDLSCTESKAKPVYKSCTMGNKESNNKQSLYYKECLPSFANFMNYPQNVESAHIKTENKSYESCHHSTTATHGDETYYSQKLNEMSQMWKEPAKSEEHLSPVNNSYYPNNMMTHPMYLPYNPYINSMPPTTAASMDFLQYYQQQQSYQQYGMLPNVKPQEIYGKSFGSPQQTMGDNEDDYNDYEDLDEMILKRKKPSSTSKRAKKMRGGIEDCNYELCNMWDEVAIPIDSAEKCIKTHSSCSEDTEGHKEFIKSESDSCDQENCDSSGTSSKNASNDAKPVTIFNFIADESVNSQCRLFLEAEKRLCQHLKMISFGEPVSHIYNPLVYAFETHLKFLKTFCTSHKTVLFLAMNPGPFGMSQNGVPFGEVSAVRDWFRISGNVQKPAREHPKRCITGLDCHRSEVSGSRFWGFFRKVCGTPEVFFRHCFVHNLCPLAFMSPTGRNITPPELRAEQRNALNQACDMALVETLNILHVKIIVCVGKFVESRVQSVLKNQGNNDIRVERITHPSPINPAANKGWDDTVYQQLKDIGIMSYFTRGD